MRHEQGNGIQQFWECQHCELRIATNYEEQEETWWSWPPKVDEVPDTCPRCESEETYVEQATLVLIEIFHEWGYQQLSVEDKYRDGWRFKIEVEA